MKERSDRGHPGHRRTSSPSSAWRRWGAAGRVYLSAFAFFAALTALCSDVM